MTAARQRSDSGPSQSATLSRLPPQSCCGVKPYDASGDKLCGLLADGHAIAVRCSKIRLGTVSDGGIAAACLCFRSPLGRRSLPLGIGSRSCSRTFRSLPGLVRSGYKESCRTMAPERERRAVPPAEFDVRVDGYVG
jgi:hypothetical protein